MPRKESKSFKKLWKVVAKFLPSIFPKGRPGRPPKYRFKAIFRAICYILRTGISWIDLPEYYPPKSVVHYWFTKLRKMDFWSNTFDFLVQKLSYKNILKFSESFVDATFVRAKGGGNLVGKTKCGKGSKLMALVEADGKPVSLFIESAQPHESKLLEPLLENSPAKSRVKRIIADRAYDSDPLDKTLLEKGIELISPNKKNRIVKNQDGRKLRRYRRRWRVEQFFAHLQNFKRLLVRYEKIAANYLAFVHIMSSLKLAAIMA